MKYLNNFDLFVICLYLLVLLGMGFYLWRRASSSLEDYFLGGKKLPWWALGITGTAQWLDITGTMIIVSFLYMLGPRGLFIEFRGGAVLVLTFLMVYVGKWHRRSNCMTGAEWNIYRFGSAIGGQATRIIAALLVTLTTIGMLAYMVKGVGLFLSMFVDYSPEQCALAMIVVATLYTMLSGFYGVVYTDILQTCIIMVAVVAIVVMAILQLNGYEGSLATLAEQVTGNGRWMSSVPHTTVSLPKGYEAQQSLLMFAFFYMLRNILAGMGSGADPKYFGARNERECGTLSYINGLSIMVRWPMMMGFAVLGIFMINKMLPDQSVVADSCILLKQHISQKVTEKQWHDGVKAITKSPDKHKELVAKLKDKLGDDWTAAVQNISYGKTSQAPTDTPVELEIVGDSRNLIKQHLIPASEWEEEVSEVINSPEKYSDLVAKLKNKLGEEDWTTKAKLIGYHEIVNPERILPAVLLYKIPPGFRGLLLIALLAASMSTFDMTVNIAAGFCTRDLYQAYFRRKAKNWELILASYGSIIIMVYCGFKLAQYTENINDIWNWVIMGLTAGGVVGGVCRLCWWRFNAAGSILSAVVGVTGAFIQRVYYPELNAVLQFVILSSISFIGLLIGTYATAPTADKVLDHFYRTTRPFGLWGPYKKRLNPDERKAVNSEHFYDIISLPIGLLWQVTLFLVPMQLIIRSWTSFWITLPIFVACQIALYFTWYKQLPPARDGVEKPGVVGAIISGQKYQPDPEGPTEQEG
ncbi:MAG: sodium:solute symporter family transporter [Planctomycetota bacterium]